jgi:hypothetical protein
MHRLLLVPFFFLLMLCTSDDNQIVARIGSEKITQKEFREKLVEEYRNKGLAELTEEEKLKTLNNMLELRRKVLWVTGKRSCLPRGIGFPPQPLPGNRALQ